ncbi:MAG: virulence-related protein [Bacillota bacterium]|nr:virulence-related protein [Bacillota bacterium]MDW7677829.1 virulence-related protein [Bacillota bacterium]
MNRKETIQILAEHFGVSPRYLKAPSFAYEIDAQKELYTIDREGIITNRKGTVVSYEELVGPARISREEEPMMQQPTADSLHVSLPMEGHSGNTLRNIVNMLAGKQHLLMEALSLNGPLMEPAFVEAMNRENCDTLEDFQAALEAAGENRCPAVTFDTENRLITFHLLTDDLTPEKTQAFMHLMASINELALKTRKASFKPAQAENPKYALRTWLIRLGMNGDDYKESRKVLLANLPGSSAFRTVGKDGEAREA